MSKQTWLLRNIIILLACLTLQSRTLESNVRFKIFAQSNVSESETMPGKQKLSQLRSFMKNVSVKGITGVEAYIVPSDDAHMSEYVQERDKRRQYISGFTGSAGTVVITLDKALLWTDGRYYAQARSEFDPPEAWTLMKDRLPETPTIEDWLSDNLPINSTVGFDPLYLDESTGSRMKSTLKEAGIHFLPIDKNLVDEIWSKDKQPAPVLNKVVPQKFIYSGKIAGDKVNDCFEKMNQNKASALVVSALDEIAYLLNWRGSDITYNPVFFSYVVLFSKKVHIFVAKERLDNEATKQLSEEKVDFELHPYENVRMFLKKICSEGKDLKKKVWIPSSSSYALHTDCESATIHKSVTPVKNMKAVKNEVEIAGMKSAHVKDGAALVKYFAWLEEKILTNSKVVTEISGIEQLDKFRQERKGYIGPASLTTSAVGEHGAIIHYSPTPKSDVPINSKEMYLCDTTAQFLDGTTDVTRTLHFGQPTEFEIEAYTRVFKGQANIATARFPEFTKGNTFEVLARKYLWDVGLNYLHGTGHGIGSYLNVHEYPPAIGVMISEDPGFQAGMFSSDEPGYYEDGKFGVRLENIVLAVYANTTYSRLNRKFLTFETVTLVPYQAKLLNVSMLSEDEVKNLNDYHQRCLNTLKPLLQGPENSQALKWLERETKPIHKN